jgi:hypothetical protein
MASIDTVGLSAAASVPATAGPAIAGPLTDTASTVFALARACRPTMAGNRLE